VVVRLSGSQRSRLVGVPLLGALGGGAAGFLGAGPTGCGARDSHGAGCLSHAGDSPAGLGEHGGAGAGVAGHPSWPAGLGAACLDGAKGGSAGGLGGHPALEGAGTFCLPTPERSVGATSPSGQGRGSLLVAEVW